MQDMQDSLICMLEEAATFKILNQTSQLSHMNLYIPVQQLNSHDSDRDGLHVDSREVCTIFSCVFTFVALL